jgi:hypothetical protein
LLDAMTAPADAMREHLAGANQNATLGAAAEVGVRNVLRAVVPARIGVTSGFLRELVVNAPASPSAAGAEAVRAAAVGKAGAKRPRAVPPTLPLSPQTDVLLYDASYAVPLYGIDGVDVLSVHDVLGVIEVKDTNQGTGDLGTRLFKHKGARGRKFPPEKDKGALEHIDSVREYAGRALRGVVLFRGNGGPPGGEAQEVKRLVLKEFAERRIYEAPHFIYCASSPIGEADKKSSKDASPPQGGYLAFYDCLSGEVRVIEYVDDRVSPLAGFWRIVTGFLASHGLISPALHLDLRPEKARSSEAFELPTVRPKPQDLHRLVSARRTTARRSGAKRELPTFETALADLLKRELKGDRRVAVQVFVSTGPTQDELPTSGFCLEVESTGKGLLRAFFYLEEPGTFICTGAGGGDTWRVEVGGEGFVDYMRRIFRENKLSDIYQKTSDARRPPKVSADAKSSAKGEP